MTDSIMLQRSVCSRAVLAVFAIFQFSGNLVHAATSLPVTQDPKPILNFDISEVLKKSAASSPQAGAAKLGSPISIVEQPRLQSWSTGPVTVAWTTLELNMFVKHKATPSRAARALALMHVAMHDALAVALQGERQSIGFPLPQAKNKPGQAPGKNIVVAARPSRHAAVAAAAATVLGYLFPSEQGYFDAMAREAGQSYLIREGLQPQDIEAGLRLGKAVGEIAVAYGQTDGAAKGWNGENLIWHGEGRPFGPGYWEPTPPYNYYPPDEPYAPYWKTWLLESASQYRPVPPAYGSPRYMRDLQEVKEVRDHLTEEQKRIAMFWVDGSGTVTPAGHWNRIALDLLGQYNLDELSTARIFAYLNMALIDAQISAWDAKYAYWRVRPITAIRSLFNVTFNSLILTPPFPSYYSGHAAFSGAGSGFLAHVFWKDQIRLKAMGEEAAMSRLYGGIHYRFDNEDGLMVGRKIARLAIERMSRQ